MTDTNTASWHTSPYTYYLYTSLNPMSPMSPHVQLPCSDSPKLKHTRDTHSPTQSPPLLHSSSSFLNSSPPSSITLHSRHCSYTNLTPHTTITLPHTCTAVHTHPSIHIRTHICHAMSTAHYTTPLCTLTPRYTHLHINPADSIMHSLHSPIQTHYSFSLFLLLPQSLGLSLSSFEPTPQHTPLIIQHHLHSIHSS